MAGLASAMCSVGPSTLSLGARGSQFRGRQIKADWGTDRVVCKKEGIHPEFFKEAKVYCNGELVMVTGGSMPEYIVDVWSGNHPFYMGDGSTLVLDADNVDKFNKKFSGLGSINTIPVLTKGEIKIEKRAVGGKKGKGKK